MVFDDTLKVGNLAKIGKGLIERLMCIGEGKTERGEYGVYRGVEPVKSILPGKQKEKKGDDQGDKVGSGGKVRG